MLRLMGFLENYGGSFRFDKEKKAWILEAGNLYIAYSIPSLDYDKVMELYFEPAIQRLEFHLQEEQSVRLGLIEEASPL